MADDLSFPNDKRVDAIRDFHPTGIHGITNSYSVSESGNLEDLVETLLGR